MAAPELFVIERRISIVPKIPPPLKLRTRLGAALEATQGSSNATPNWELSWTGDARFCGPGAPRRCPPPADVPLVSTK